jgi:flavodoxin
MLVYYSYDGNTAFIADSIKNALKADMRRLEVVDEKRHSGLVKYIWGGRQAVMGKHPALKPYTVDFSEYDLLIVGCPVWAGSPAPAMMTFLESLEKLPMSGKRAAVFCCSMGGQGRTLETLKARLSACTIAGEKGFVIRRHADKAALAEQAAAWAASLIV